MCSLPPSEIRSLRHELDWSAGELGAFLGRSSQTVYNWEGGTTEPDEFFLALLRVLRDELHRRRAKTAKEGVERWKERLERNGVSAFLQSLGRPSAPESGAELGPPEIGSDPHIQTISLPNHGPRVLIVCLSSRALKDLLDT